MGARRTSRLIASAVALATFSSIAVVLTAFAAEDTIFVEEKTTDDTVNLNGVEFDENGKLLKENNAGDKAMEELDAEETAKPISLDELAQTEASNDDVNVKVDKDEKRTSSFAR